MACLCSRCGGLNSIVVLLDGPPNAGDADEGVSLSGVVGYHGCRVDECMRRRRRDFDEAKREDSPAGQFPSTFDNDLSAFLTILCYECLNEQKWVKLPTEKVRRHGCPAV